MGGRVIPAGINGSQILCFTSYLIGFMEKKARRFSLARKPRSLGFWIKQLSCASEVKSPSFVMSSCRPGLNHAVLWPMSLGEFNFLWWITRYDMMVESYGCFQMVGLGIFL